jgi:hypothetical protein
MRNELSFGKAGRAAYMIALLTIGKSTEVGQ